MSENDENHETIQQVWERAVEGQEAYDRFSRTMSDLRLKRAPDQYWGMVGKLELLRTWWKELKARTRGKERLNSYENEIAIFFQEQLDNLAQTISQAKTGPEISALRLGSLRQKLVLFTDQITSDIIARGKKTLPSSFRLLLPNLTTIRKGIEGVKPSMQKVAEGNH